MPEQKSNVCVSFDRKVIRSKITNLSYKEARRVKGPIYRVLLKELLEEGCTKTHNYIECLLAKENKFIYLNYVSWRLKDVPEYFMTIVDNLKLAELSVKLSYGGGWLAALKILYQTMIVAQSQQNKYDWFVNDIFDIVINMIKDLDEEDKSYDQLKMRIYYKYAININQRGTHFSLAISYFNKAFELTKGEKWRPDDASEQEKFGTMYEAISPKLADVLLAQGRKVLQKSPEAALDYATEAVRALSAISWNENKYMACMAALTKTLFMIECQKYEMALSYVTRLQPHIIKDQRSEFFRMHCETYLYQGLCYYNLNEIGPSLNAYRTGYMSSRKWNIQDIQAQFLVNIGRAYGKIKSKLKLAIDAYLVARRIFVILGDNKNKMKTTYLLAKLKADQLFPQLMNLIESENYCDFYRFRQWKNLCKPFWKQEARFDLNTRLTTMESMLSEEMNMDDLSAVHVIDALEYSGHRKSHIEFSADVDDDIFYAKEKLISDTGMSTSFAKKIKMPERRDRDKLDCLLQEFENVETNV